MQTPNPLDQLRPNHIPDPVGCWPPAPGWWLAGLLMLLLLALCVFLIVRYIRKNRYRRQAIKQAKNLYHHFQKHNDQRRFAHECNSLLKKTALHAFSERQPARLHSQNWQTFLAETSRISTFTEAAGGVFGAGKYQQDQRVDARQVYALTLSWIKKHHA